MSDIIQLARYTSNAVQGQKKYGTVYNNASDNLFSNYLNSLYNNSPTHQCIIDDIAQQVVGLGLASKNKEQSAKLNELLNKKKLLQIARGLLVQECVPLEVIRNPLKDIKKIKYVDASHWRVSKMDDDDKPIEFAYRKEWNPKSNLYSYKSAYINSYNNEDLNSLLYYYDSGTYLTPYGRPSYLSATDAIELEYAIYKMHNHGAWNGMFPSMVISKETAGEKEDRKDTAATQRQVVGPANAGKIITTYYRQGGNAPTFSTPNLSGLDKIYENQYQTAEIGILKAWRIPSANLISGLNSKGSGFTSETEELAYATERMRVKIIEPRREQLLDMLSPIFSELGIEDVEFSDVKEEVVVDSVPKLSKEKDFDDDEMLEALEGGEIIDLDEWELVDSREANDEDCEEWANRLIKPKVSQLEALTIKLESFIKSAPNKRSALDKDVYKIRYTYQGGGSGKSRKFCSAMMGRTSRGVVYRKEDIDEASFRGVNNEFGHKRQNYSLFKYKGGVNCKHYWREELYRMKDKTEIYISRGKEVESIPSRFKPKGAEYNDAKEKPFNMPNRGHHPNYGK